MSLLFIGFSAFSVDIIIYTKKREPFASILVCSGLDSHLFQYTQKAHVKTRAICIILGKRYSNCREMNKSSNKANAYFSM